MTRRPKIDPVVQNASKAAVRDAAAFATLTAIRNHLAQLSSMLPDLQGHVTADESRYLTEHAEALARHLERGGAALTARVAHATSSHAARNADRWYEAAFLRQLTEAGLSDAEKTDALQALNSPKPRVRGTMSRDLATQRASQAVYRERDAAEKHQLELEQRADTAEAELRAQWAEVGAEAVLGAELAARLPNSGRVLATASPQSAHTLERCLEASIRDRRRQILGS